MRKLPTTAMLISRDYRVVEDAWGTHRRRTYIHDEDATREYISRLVKALQTIGWEIDKEKLRSFHHPATGEIIELEPGGSEATGHFLHYMTAACV